MDEIYKPRDIEGSQEIYRANVSKEAQFLGARYVHTADDYDNKENEEVKAKYVAKQLARVYAGRHLRACSSAGTPYDVRDGNSG